MDSGVKGWGRGWADGGGGGGAAYFGGVCGEMCF